jgi:hypothetical protein
MKSFYTLLIVLLISTVSAQAQRNSGTVKAKITDSTGKTPLKGATISLMDAKDSTLLSFALSKEDGSFEMTGVSYGDHLLLVTFSGFAEVYKKITLSKTITEADLGVIKLVTESKDLGTVTVKTAPIVVKGDTTEFTANSFKTKPNATAEDLLKKLPGVQVEKDGTVKAQGQNVTRVLVDGKRFFGDDPKTATRNLPTDVIDKVQVYDAQSDQSSFSGFDDGTREKTINIITKKDRRKGLFGKGSIGAGENKTYASSLSFNRFNGNQQISFIGQGNNINQQNFSIQDLLGVMNTGGGGRGGGGAMAAIAGGGRGGGNIGNFLTQSAPGISTTWAGGLNYNDVWGKKTSVSGSYFYNDLATNRDQTSFKETFINNDSSIFNNIITDANSQNRNHRFNFEIDHKIDSFNSVLIRPQFSQQHNDSYTESNSFTTKGKLVNLSGVRQINESVSDGYNFNTSILLRHRFKKRGRTVSVNITPGLSTNASDRTNLSYNDIYSGSTFVKDTVNQISTTDRDGKSFSSNVSFTEPIDAKSQMEFNYGYNYNENISDQKTLRYNKATGQYDLVVANLTNNFENLNTSHRVGTSYRRQVTKDWSYTLGMAVQLADLTSDNRTKNTLLTQSFTNFFPNMQIQYSKNRTKSLRINYRGRTNAPSVTQLQDVVDNTNLLNIRNGNPALKQEFNHSFNLFFSNFNIFTFKNFFAGINGSFTQNKIGNSVIQNTGTTPMIVDGVALINGAQYTKPTNVNGALNATAFVNYGFPVKRPKSNINLTTNISYIRDVNLFNNAKNFTNNYVFGETIGFNMNVKDKFDINFSSSSTFTMARYSLNKEQNGDFFTQILSVEPTYSTKNGWIFGSDFDYTLYRGQSAGFNQSVPLWNASIAKTVFKKKDGEIKLSVFDLLNQNQSISRTVEQNFIQDTRTQVLTRYVMLTFTYNLRKFGGNNAQQGMPRIPGMFRNNGQPRMNIRM